MSSAEFKFKKATQRWALFCTLSLSTLASIPIVFASYTDAEIRTVETSEESKIREIRNQEILQLRTTLGRRFPVNRQAELYFRLAEIYMEAYHTDYILEGRVHDKKIAAGVSESSMDHSRSQRHLLNGIKACQEILAFKIPFSKLDHIYYFLGFNYGELGEKSESIKYYDALVQHFPNSPFAQEAYRELGEFNFLGGQFRKAISFFEAGIRSVSRSQLEIPPSLPRIRHRLAWSYYRVRDFDRAIQEMKLAIEESQKSGEKFLSLREEALRDMAIFMTETGKVDEAIRYFQSVAGDDQLYPKILEKLGAQYERNVEPLKATQVYESLLKTHPNADASFRVLVKLVDLDLRRGRYKEALSRLKGVKGRPEEDVGAAYQNLRAMIRRTGTENHDKFRKKNDRLALEIAESYYSSYLNVFLKQDDPRHETPEIQMYLADALRELGKSAEASALYRKVVDSKDQRYSKEAGLLWTASLSEAIKKTGNSQKELSDLEKEFVSASDSLSENLGDTTEGREAALRAAQVLAGYDSTRSEAMSRINDMIRKWPKTPQAVTAARLKIQLLGRPDADHAKELKSLIQEYRENLALMQADQEYDKGALKSLIIETQTRLQVLAISENEKQKDFAGAAHGYEDFARDSSQVDLAEKAYRNAINNYIKAEDVESIDRVSTAWLKRFPNSIQASESLRVAATQLLIEGSFEASAKIFEKAGLSGKEPDSLETAGRIYEANQSIFLAEKSWAKYLENFSTGRHRPWIALSLGKLYANSGREGEAAKMYRLCMSSSSDLYAECGIQLGDLYLKSKNFDEAKKTFEQVSRVNGKGPFSPYIGYARFKLAYQLESSAHFPPLELPDVKLKKALDSRLEFLAPLSRAYLSVVDAGGPWSVSALDRLAQWAYQFADEVDQIQVPSNASEAAIEKFKKNLTAISAPLRSKAAYTWSESYAKSVQAELYSSVIPEIADRLADLKVSKPGRAQGYWKKFQLAGVPSDGGEEGAVESFRRVREKLVKNPQDGNAWLDYGNLLWGEGRPGMARLAYDRTLSINRRNSNALNNRAVLLLSQSTQSSSMEVAISASEAAALFREALKNDDFFLPAKINLATLRNYYRHFEKAKNLWEQVLVKVQAPFVYDGLAISLQGLGDSQGALNNLNQATALGAPSKRFALQYHKAVQKLALQNEDSHSQCLSHLNELHSSSLFEFEKMAVERLKRTCQ